MPFAALDEWTPPGWGLRVTTIDAHTGGEPLRIVVGGVPPIRGETMLERRRYAREHFDHVRVALMREPRGHRDMYGCFVTPPVTPGAHFGVIFMHNEGYSTMCGHGVIAVAAVAVQAGLVPRAAGDTEVRIDTPAGLVTARVCQGGHAAPGHVVFRNVPSFVLALDRDVDVPGAGLVKCDIAFGGAFYAYVDASRFGFRGVPDETASLVAAGMAVKHAVARAHPIVHPLEPDLSFLYGTIFLAPPLSSGSHSRNVCVFADGQVDRSPTGTGVSGRLAIHDARAEIAAGETIVIESIVGSRFSGTIVGRSQVGPHAAVIPEIGGEAHVTGRHAFVIDPADPLGAGFLLGTP